MDNRREYKLAKEIALKNGFDFVTFDREYNGGLLFLAQKTATMHKYAGCPMYVLVKDSDVIVFTGKDVWSFIYSDN